jgi:hypothetical protein
MRGIFYNSKQALCSIWESGKMCYNVLNKSDKYTLDYSEDCFLDCSYDFAIFNHHFITNNWINKEMIDELKKKSSKSEREKEALKKIKKRFANFKNLIFKNL